MFTAFFLVILGVIACLAILILESSTFKKADHDQKNREVQEKFKREKRAKALEYLEMARKISLKMKEERKRESEFWTYCSNQVEDMVQQLK